MKIIRIDQPWARAAVCGMVEVLNMPGPWRLSPGTEIAIVAGGMDRRIPARGPGREAAMRQLGAMVHYCVPADHLVGAVTIAGSSLVEDCQLRLAFGPHCWLIGESRILPDPVYWPWASWLPGEPDLTGRWSAMALARALRKAMTPAAYSHWHMARETERAAASGVLDASPDGWTGD